METNLEEELEYGVGLLRLQPDNLLCEAWVDEEGLLASHLAGVRNRGMGAC